MLYRNERNRQQMKVCSTTMHTEMKLNLPNGSNFTKREKCGVGKERTKSWLSLAINILKAKRIRRGAGRVEERQKTGPSILFAFWLFVSSPSKMKGCHIKSPGSGWRRKEAGPVEAAEGRSRVVPTPPLEAIPPDAEWWLFISENVMFPADKSAMRLSEAVPSVPWFRKVKTPSSPTKPSSSSIRSSGGWGPIGSIWWRLLWLMLCPPGVTRPLRRLFLSRTRWWPLPWLHCTTTRLMKSKCNVLN